MYALYVVAIFSTSSLHRSSSSPHHQPGRIDPDAANSYTIFWLRESLKIGEEHPYLHGCRKAIHNGGALARLG